MIVGIVSTAGRVDLIVDIPTSEELRVRADALLHLAFSMSMKLHHDQSDDWAIDVDNSARDEYWAKCGPALANALALVQQAHELYLKSRIVAVSPFLIIAREPSQWPRDGASRDISFSEFLTLGAAELPKVHDMVCPERLDEGTRTFLKNVRELRNAFVHQGAAASSRAGETIDLVLRTHHWMYPSTPWFTARADYLYNDHISALYSTDHVPSELHAEFAVIRETVKPADFKTWLGFNKKGRWYRCGQCSTNMGDFGDPEHTAQLEPNTPKSTQVVCLVCGGNTVVERRSCHDPSCPSTVHAHPDEQMGGQCLVCLADENFEREEAERKARAATWRPEVLLGLVPAEVPNEVEEWEPPAAPDPAS